MTDTPDRLPKRLTAARFAGVFELEEAFRDVSGESDISDGEGVREPSEGEPVTLIQESLLAMGYELPGGADGYYGPATRQAVMEFQIDAGHPWPPGQEWEHIGGISGSNTLAHFDMFDPGGTVSSHTPDETGVPATAVTFRESYDHPFMGFDASTTPPSLVVGTTTRRRVRVEREPAGSDVTFAAADPAIATVRTTHEGIVVGGESAGTTTVRALAGGGVLGELLVNVKDARDVVVNFFFASGSTERDHEQATLLTLRLNRLWRRQANVHFTLGLVEDIDLPAIVGPVVGAADAEHFAPSAVPGDLNVFCVRVWDGTGYDPTQADPFLFFLPDLDCPDGMDLVRGAGVYLGGGAQPACGSGEERRRISKALADRVNPFGHVKSLDTRVAIVTGAAHGIGRGIASVLAAEGAKVAIADIDRAGAEAAAAALPGAVALEVDVTKRESTDAMAADTLEAFGRIDILAANAGIYPMILLADIDDAEWDRVLDINLKGGLHAIPAYMPAMLAAGYGRIVLTSSITGPITGQPGFAHYGASKAAQLGMMRSLALEVATRGITINAVMPGNVATEGLDDLGEEHKRNMMATIPMREFADPADVGWAVRFLASEEARYITGQTLVVDGGQVLPESPDAVLGGD